MVVLVRLCSWATCPNVLKTYDETKMLTILVSSASDGSGGAISGEGVRLGSQKISPYAYPKIYINTSKIILLTVFDI